MNKPPLTKVSLYDGLLWLESRAIGLVIFSFSYRRLATSKSVEINVEYSFFSIVLTSMTRNGKEGKNEYMRGMC